MALDSTPQSAGRAEGNKRPVVKKRWGFHRSKQLEQDLTHVNREIYARNLELAQTNKTLALLQKIDSLVLGDEADIHPLCAQLSQEIMQSLDCPLVAILGYPGHREHQQELVMYGWATPGLLEPAHATTLDALRVQARFPWLASSDSSLRLVKLGHRIDAEIVGACNCSEAVISDLRKATGVDSVCLIKLSARQHLVGLMVIGFGSAHERGLSEFEESLFVRLSQAVGIAVDHKLLLDENKRVVAQLTHTNEKLRALDQIKDDFISMASHQLRTPLTSVKGYVSMVLDGDAGEITDFQRKMLNQSFLSSQRMAYLISDLLNVSRLRTGKFIIEPVPTNLAAVIEEEITQLKETAKGRGLALTFHKPERFPTLMLDETKLRQVIMNFIDNAVYYTPSGGHIDVYLEDRPASIEFRVVDDGIGVPKAEQHHLFGKFYRAHNARRARPDGTGLGIFMAKKVIIAQGGAVIFKSAEGKGSTFGFTFPKAKLRPPARAKTLRR